MPDLIVEVVSPGSFRRDRKEKFVTYTKYKVPEYWLADPVNGTLEQYLFIENQLVLSAVYEGDDLVRSDRLQCVIFTMSELVRTIPKLGE